ncbi:MAG: hypothetical protein HQM01_07175 [Magnetococcales bacterium]|nr:hypothetical protein [Magnetococcales bacterium]
MNQNTEKLQVGGGQFRPGQSGNPNGRPRGTTKKLALRELLAPHAPDLIEALVTAALNGDMSAMKICMDRLVPPLRPAVEPNPLPLPVDLSTANSVEEAGTVILSAVSEGTLSVEDAERLGDLVERQHQRCIAADAYGRLSGDVTIQFCVQGD